MTPQTPTDRRRTTVRRILCLFGVHRWKWRSYRDHDDAVRWTIPACTRCGERNPDLVSGWPT